MLRSITARNIALGVLILTLGVLAYVVLIPGNAGATHVTVDLKADGVDDELVVEEGETFTLTWTTTGNPSKCKAFDGWSGLKNPNGGSEVQGPITERTKYKIRCGLGAERFKDIVWVDVVPPDPGDDVTLLFTESCTSSEGNCVHHHLNVSCQGLPDRIADVWEYEPTGTSSGAVLFTVGGYGKGLYGGNPGPRRDTRDAVVNAGFEAFAIGWEQQPIGWFVEGAGYADSACGHGLIAQWLHDNRVNEPSAMCAAGNSGGAFQIMYGIELYGSGDVLDMVVPSAGPPIGDVEAFCFDPNYPLAGGGGAGPTDEIMGWDGNGDYCTVGSGPQSAHDDADRTSLLSDLEPRTLNYPNTKVNLVYSEDDLSGQRGAEYVNALTSDTAIHTLPGSVHGIDETAAGAAVIQNLLLTECVDNS